MNKTLDNQHKQSPLSILSDYDIGALRIYAHWLSAIIREAQLIGCDIDEPGLDIYHESNDIYVGLDDPVAFTTEMFRCGSELSSKLLGMEGHGFPMGCLVPQENARRLRTVKRENLAACVLGLQYHAWYESTKYICFVVGALCDGPPPWSVSSELDQESGSEVAA
jgi:hypothetical protein